VTASRKAAATHDVRPAARLKQDYLQIKVLELAPQVYVSGQLFEEDIRLAARQGFRSILNSRSDGETIGQPASAQLARVAGEYGIEFAHFPVDPKSITAKDIDEFSRLCDELERPLLIFSRTGARSTKIWELSQESAAG